MKILHHPVRLFLLSVLFAFCDSSKTEDTPETPVEGSVRLVSAFPKLSFRRPVDFQQPADNTNRVFVVEQAGVISVFPKDASTAEKKIFLDIRSKVKDSGNEEGLLGLAFHPDYETNGFFYLNYTASNLDRTVIARYRVSSSADQADEASEQVVLTFAQPYSNHNGGQVVFGPDGYLYIAVGDGGSGGDPQDNGQNRATLLGSILRIDVNKEEYGNKYAIPPDNPFANNTSGYREEIYAYGLRNPWRISFDAANGRLWAGDVGQNAYEEIDIIEKGGNYGWKPMEGKHCYVSNCDQTGLKMPIWEYPRTHGISVTGGFVYRGATIASLKGKYIYADYGSQRIWALDHTDINSPSNSQLFVANFPISSFGVDVENELYACGFDGRIYKFVN